MVVALLGAAPAGPRLEMHVARATLDPLDTIDVTLRVYNARSTPLAIRFGQTAEYGLALSRDASVLWASAATTVGQPHARTFSPGHTTLVTYEWNGILADGTAPAPGAYVLRATLLSTGTQVEARATVRVAAPYPISALSKIGAQIVTIAGTLDKIGTYLHDASGEVKLARRIPGLAAGTTVDVRGSIGTQPDGTKAFEIQRWAPTVAATPSPAPTATPHR